MTETDRTLLLDLDERNLAHFFSALALTAFAQRVEGSAIDARRCWWPKLGSFAIQTELPTEEFRPLLFAQAYEFLKAMKWLSGIGGVEQGIIISGKENGINPFVPLGGDSNERPLLRAFSAKVVPVNVLPQQIEELKSPVECASWLNQVAVGSGRRVKTGVSSWGYDCVVNMHASDAGISSDAEGTGHLDPIFPAIELLSLAGSSFFATPHAWTLEGVALNTTAWTERLPLDMSALAASGRIHGLACRKLAFIPRRGAHGKGGSFRFFPPATLLS